MKSHSDGKTSVSYAPVTRINLGMERPASSSRRKTGSQIQVQVTDVQADYIENLQQQVYCLENEVAYLRSQLQDATRSHPTMVAEAENMVKKLLESQKEIQSLKVEMRRVQTALDMITAEKERLIREIQENEGSHKTQKSACLDEMVGLRKQRDDLLDKVADFEKALKDSSYREEKLLDSISNFQTDMDNLKQELCHSNEVIQKYKKKVEFQQKEYFEEQLKAETAAACDRQASLKELKAEIQHLHEKLQQTEQTAEHEKILRARLSEDNAMLIKRHADLETGLVELRSFLREEQGIRASLEALHSRLASEVSETRSHDVQLKTDLEGLIESLKQEKEHSQALACQLLDEQRHKTREQQKVTKLERQLEQKGDKLKIREKENTELERNNKILKDQVASLEKQLQERDIQIESLKGKVQEMQMSVEEFVHSTQVASRLQGHRWRQLLQLAQGIQSLSQKAANEQEL